SASARALHSSLCMYVLFFFSSRRRHTRCYRDWSSDVCSSDLGERPARSAVLRDGAVRPGRVALQARVAQGGGPVDALGRGRRWQIGRASCRERVWVWGGAGSVYGGRRVGGRVWGVATWMTRMH